MKKKKKKKKEHRGKGGRIHTHTQAHTVFITQSTPNRKMFSTAREHVKTHHHKQQAHRSYTSKTNLEEKKTPQATESLTHIKNRTKT